MLINETIQLLQYRFSLFCWVLKKLCDSICLHRLLTSMVSLSFPPAIVFAYTMYLSPRFLRGLGSVACPIFRHGCYFGCHFSRGFCRASLIMYIGCTLWSSQSLLTKHKEANFFMACLTGACRLCRGSTSAHARAKRQWIRPACAVTEGNLRGFSAPALVMCRQQSSIILMRF